MQRHDNPFIEECYANLAQTILSKLPPEEIYPKSALLQTHKHTIIERTFLNLGLIPNQALTDQQQADLKIEFTQIVFMLSGLPSFFENGDDLESPSEDGHDKYKTLARNFLRFFMRGSKVTKKNDWIWNSPVFVKELYDTIQVAGHPELLFNVREQIQAYLNKAYEYLVQCEQLEEKKEDDNLNLTSLFLKSQMELVQIELGPLLAAMAFFNYQEEEKHLKQNNVEELLEEKIVLNLHKTIFVPVRLKDELGNDKWHSVEYGIEKLDISPRPTDSGLDGIIGSLLSEKDRFYMYGLNPIHHPSHAKANPILLLNGTPYPGVPGEPLADIYNFGIGQSVGESHNLTAIREWIERQEDKIISYGHSKGGAIGQVLVAEYPGQFQRLEILNSPGLEDATLARIKAREQNPIILAPEIISYRQRKNGTKDPVSRMGRFLPGTKSRHVLVDDKGPSLNAYPIPAGYANVLESHSFPTLGYQNVLILNGNAEEENKGKLRAFLTMLKSTYNYFASTQGKLNLIIYLCNKKLNVFCNKHQKLLSSILFGTTVTTFITAIVLSTLGVGGIIPLVPLLAKALPVSTNIALALSYGIVSMSALAVSAALTYLNVIPKLLKTAGNIILTIANKAFSAVGFTTTLLLVMPSAIKNSVSALYRNPQPLKNLAIYVGSLQIVPDLISVAIGILSVLAKIPYIAGAGLVALVNYQLTNQKVMRLEPAFNQAIVSPAKFGHGGSTKNINQDLGFGNNNMAADVHEPAMGSFQGLPYKQIAPAALQPEKSLACGNDENDADSRKNISPK